jgi:peptide chain release factor 1
MAEVHERLIAKLADLAEQYEALESQLADPAVAADHEQVRELSQKRSAMSDMVGYYRRWQALQKQIEEHQQLVSDNEDAELVEMAKSELPELQAQAQQVLEQATNELVTADDKAIQSVMLELRAGAGGAEAGLWAGELFEMYQAYAAQHKWKFETLDFMAGEQGGLRHAVANVKGKGVWQGLGYEGGVHCVKRVPATETQGRVHTSTATVAVLPEPEQLEVEIGEDEVEEHVTGATGPGGQNVNKVATAVNLVHQPTGIEVRMQESKSQHQNRAKAWQLLRARVHDHYQRQKDAERAEQRSQMIGSAGRSERIRTYRWKENMAVDHRLGASFNLQTIMSGDLDGMVEQLITQDRAMRLAAL